MFADGSYGQVAVNPPQTLYSMQQAIPIYERFAGTRPCGSFSRVSRASLSDAVVLVSFAKQEDVEEPGSEFHIK